MDRKRLGWVLVVLGVVLLAVSALADPIGIGDGEGVGLKQILGMIAGVVVSVLGLAMIGASRRGAGPAQADI